MKCPVKDCPGEMVEKTIIHTFVRHGQPLVVEGIPAQVCPACGYTVFNLEVLDMLFSFDPDTVQPERMAPVYKLQSFSIAA
jgi:YgiT-type zinc finger domain-containing protein